jgi:hypothetical protein
VANFIHCVKELGIVRLWELDSREEIACNTQKQRDIV